MGLTVEGRTSGATGGGYQIYGLTEKGPSSDFHEAAERGDRKYLISVLERSLDFDVDVKVRTAPSLYAMGHETS